MDQGQGIASNGPGVSSAARTSVPPSGPSNGAWDKYLKKEEVENEKNQWPQAHKEWGQQPHVDKGWGQRPQALDKYSKKQKVSNGGEQWPQPQVDKGWGQWQVGEWLLGRQQKFGTGWSNAWEKDKERRLYEEWKKRADVDLGSTKCPPGFEQHNKWGQHTDLGLGQRTPVDKGGEEQPQVGNGQKHDYRCGQRPPVDKGQGQLPHPDKAWEQHVNKDWGQNKKSEQKADVETGSGHWPDVNNGCEQQTQVGKGQGKGPIVKEGLGQRQPAKWGHTNYGRGDHLERPQVQDDHLERPQVQDGWGQWTPEQSPSSPCGWNDPVYIAVSALQEMMNRAPDDHGTPCNDLQVAQATGSTYMVTEKVLSMKLLIDSKAKRVLFAETEKEVIDFLFNILALPVASIVELITKKNMVGSMGNLYESVESINPIYVQPNLDKSSLLKPAVVLSAGNIPLLPPSVRPRRAKYYRCINSYHCCVTNLPGTRCPKCDRKMMNELSYLAAESSDSLSTDAGYVKGGLIKYLLTDDLYVMPLSTMSSITLFKKFNVVDVSFLEEKIVDFGIKEGLEVLKAALQSKTVLTEVFPWKDTAPETHCDLQPAQTIMETEDTNVVSENTSIVTEKVFSIKILIDSKARRVLFAEAEKELIDFLFGLLALPVASIIELVKKKNMVGSIGNIYESVENITSSYIQPNLDRNSLLKPNVVLPAGNIPLLPPSIGTLGGKYYICSTSFHHSYLTSLRGSKCPNCPVGNYPMNTEMSYVAGGVSDVSSTEDGYVRGEVKYVVTDELVVIPTPSVSSIALLKKYDVVDVNILEEKTFDFGIKEGLEVLKAALTSKKVLTKVFGKKMIPEMQYEYFREKAWQLYLLQKIRN